MTPRLPGAFVLILLGLAGCDGRSGGAEPLRTDAVECSNPNILEGDTLLCAGVRVRLFGVNAPEGWHIERGIRKEPGYDASKDRLRTLTRGFVRCAPEQSQYDPLGRMLARCSTAKVADLGAAMIHEGYACQWRRFSKGAYDGVGVDCDKHGKRPRA